MCVVPVRHNIYVVYELRKSTSSLDQKCTSSFREQITRVLEFVMWTSLIFSELYIFYAAIPCRRIGQKTLPWWPAPGSCNAIQTAKAEINTDLFCKKTTDSLVYYTLQRNNTENSKQIFPEKELLVLSQNFHIHVSVRNLYITTIGLPILLQENMWTEPGNI
jgi:hypothetical protein